MIFTNECVILVAVDKFPGKKDPSRMNYVAVLADKKSFASSSIFLANENPESFMALAGRGMEFFAEIDYKDGKYTSVRLSQ